MEVKLEKYAEKDCIFVYKLFYNTVHSVNAADYNLKQLCAWAPSDFDSAKWNESLLSNYSFVAKAENEIVGFGDITQNGYLDRLYVHKNFQRMGIATLLCDKLENIVDVQRIHTHASLTARGFFEKRGYRFIREQNVDRLGVTMTNCIMVKTIK